MIRIVTSILLISFSTGLLAQQHPDFLAMRSAESELKELYDELYQESPAFPDSLLMRIELQMEEALSSPGAMDYPWTGLDRIGMIESEDGRLRIFTWHYEDHPDAFRYTGYMQVRKKRGDHQVYALNDNQLPQRGLYRADQSVDHWYGKLYYGMVIKKHRRKTYYTIMGLDFNNSRSNIKSVEVLSLQRNRPRFEQELFFNGTENADRVVLEYSDQVAITIRYDPMLDLIVYDHLVPLHNVYVKNLEFYGPDGSYDGLEFSEGVWNFREDIDARLRD